MRLARFDLPVLVFGLVALYFLGSGVRGAIHQSWDFAPVYSGARCLLRGCNPYSTSQLNTEFLRAGGHEQVVEQVGGWESVPPLYPPSALCVLAPLALLPFSAAVLFWSLLNGSLFMTAAILVLVLCPQRYKWLAAALTSFFLFTGIELLKDGQPAAFAVAALIIGAVFFLNRRHLLPAAFLLMLSLAIKPQIGGLALIFFLTDKSLRRYAALALSGALALLLLGGSVLASRPPSRTWASDLRANITASLAPGSVNDPAQPATGIIHLEAISSVLLPDRKISRVLARSIFLVLLATWAIACFRRSSESPPLILSISALLVLSLLPVYHRGPDAAVLLLSVPSLLLIIRERRILGITMACVTIPACVSIPAILNGYLSAHAPALREAFLHSRYLIFLVLSNASDLPAKFHHLLDSKIVFLLVLRQQNFALLLLACLYIVAVFTVRPSRESSDYEETRRLVQPVVAG